MQIDFNNQDPDLARKISEMGRILRNLPTTIGGEQGPNVDQITAQFEAELGLSNGGMGGGMGGMGGGMGGMMGSPGMGGMQQPQGGMMGGGMGGMQQPQGGMMGSPGMGGMQQPQGGMMGGG